MSVNPADRQTLSAIPNTKMDIQAEKQALRSRMRAARRAVSPQKRAEMDKALLRNILTFPAYAQADILLLYVSAGGEAGTHALLEHALAEDRRIALPRCEAQGQMRFFLIDSLNDLQPGAYGIPEPVGNITPPITEHTLCLVPGVAFTPDGYRLGQGGGYYDRFLQKYPFIRTAGICYALQLTDSLPHAPHDRCMEAIITEQIVEVCNGIQV